MTKQQNKSGMKMCRNEIRRLNRNGADGPRYIPILPRHGTYLFCLAGDGERFAKLFRQTWRKLPLSDRRKILKYWRETYYRFFGDQVTPSPWPLVEMVPQKSNFSRGNSADAMAQYSHFHCSFAFEADAMDALPDHAVEATIAHELAHAVLCIEDATYHLDPANTEYDAWGFSQSEYFADKMAEDWGFDMEAQQAALLELYPIAELKEDSCGE
jgi:hypothetical protein